jgi:glycerol-3-phosphate O-acyltransferase
MKSFLKELRTTIKLSAIVEQAASGLTADQWKRAVDLYIFGVRRYLLADKTNQLGIYLKYGMMRDNYQFRKQSFLHWGLVRGKVQNVNEFDSRSFRDRITNCRKVNDAIQEDLSQYIQKNPEMTENDLLNRKKLIEADIRQNLDLMSTHFQKFGMLSLAMASHYMFRHMFEGIIFDNQFIEFVRNHDYRRGPIIFLPTHKSYMDFLILSYLLVMRDARPPLIGAADNMNNIILVSRLFKLSGAFYIKRTGQKFPKVYRAILNEYLKSVMENEMNLEFFIEATRSRTGQILYPKFGMLKYVVEAYLEKRIPDAVLIPLNITYENLIESDSYIGEHRGGQKVQEDTLRVIKATRLIYRNYGKVIINSSQPISLKRYIDWTLKGPEGSISSIQEDEFVEKLGLDLTDTLQQKSVFMQTHLLCALLLMRQHYQLVKDLEANMRLLSVQVKLRNGLVFEAEEHDFNFDAAVKCFRNRLSIRGDTFNERRVCIDRKDYIENSLALKYYANSLNYLFFIEGLIHFGASCQTALEKTVKISELWRKVELLQDLFKKEIFITNWLASQEEMEEFIKNKK